jgi:precorrin-2 dehydrogenase / sirohydrochlorin ferrochelatase
MSRFGYPISLDVSGKRAVVIGDEAVRQGKVDALRAAGADVTVVVDWPFRREDLDGVFVCVASSEDPTEREAIFRACRERGVLVNVMDDPARCDFAAPAVVRRGDLTMAVSTSGRSPALARKLREELERRFGPEWAEVLDVLGEVRDQTTPHLPDLPTRIARWSDALDLDEIEELVRTGRADEARHRLRERLLGVEVG